VEALTATPWFAAHVLPTAIKEFRDSHPDLHVQLFDGNLSAIARRVEANANAGTTISAQSTVR
jgi:DNA-binding transcriptional LysR family regulator